MRANTNKAGVQAFMAALGRRVLGEGSIYLAGGATAVLHDWRPSTLDIDVKPDPEPRGFFEAVAVLKDELSINIELACPDQFIPALPGWRDRSLFIARHERLNFYHYDPYGQALAKMERRHERDLADVQSFLRSGLIQKDRLWELFLQVEPQMIRFPAIDRPAFQAAVKEFCDVRG